MCYYPNCVATYNAILECGDIEKNPGPGFDRQSHQKHNATAKTTKTKTKTSFMYILLGTNACYMFEFNNKNEKQNNISCTYKLDMY